MSERLVLCCRLPSAGEAAQGRTYLERARSILVRAEARDGTLVAWGAERLYFAFEPSGLADVIALVTTPGEECLPREERFAFGVAQGPLERLEGDGSRGELAWGQALVAAGALAASARSGDVLMADRVKAVRAGELVIRGGCFAEEAGIRLRGCRLDVQQPWRRDAAATVGRLAEPEFIGTEPEASALARPGALTVLRASPGAGGTRRLTALAARHGERSLTLRPVGASLEPFGALRRAMAKAVSSELPPALAPHVGPLEALLSGEGLETSHAHDLVAAYMEPRSAGAGAGMLLVDDAARLDPESLAVCAALMRGIHQSPVVLRLGLADPVPEPFAKIPVATTVTVAPLTEVEGERVAAAATRGALDDESRKRWARLGAGTPLGIVEAISHGLASTDLAWIGDRAFARRKGAGRGKPRPAAQFLTLRALECAPSSRTVLTLVALLGGEAKIEDLGTMAAVAEQRISAEAVVAELLRSRWLSESAPGWVALPSRTHVEALATLAEPPLAAALHRAAADVIEEAEPGLGRLQAAHHARATGDMPRVVQIVRSCLPLLAQAKLAGAILRLLAYAGLSVSEVKEVTEERTMPDRIMVRPAVPPNADGPTTQPNTPASEDRVEPAESLEAADSSDRTFVQTKPRAPSPALQPIKAPAQALDSTASTHPDLVLGRHEVVPDSEPPTLAEASHLAALGEADTVFLAPPETSHSPVAPSRAERAKQALRSSNQEELDRLIGLASEAGDTAFAERIGALAKLQRGEAGDALRMLRRVRHGAAVLAPVKCQASLSLGVAFAAAGRNEEALLEALTALARAREAGDPRGIQACFAFLAKLFHATARSREAALLQSASTMAAVP